MVVVAVTVDEVLDALFDGCVGFAGDIIGEGGDAGEDLRCELEKRHVGEAPRTKNCEKPETGGRQAVEVREGIAGSASSTMIS